jgi:hypothetical protein
LGRKSGIDLKLSTFKIHCFIQDLGVRFEPHNQRGTKMKRSHAIVLTAVLLISAIAFAGDSAQVAFQAQKDHGSSVGAFVPIPHEFTDRALMTNMKWAEETVFQRIISKWDTYTGEQGFKDKDVLRTAEIKICEVAFSVEAVRFKADGVYQFIFSTKPGESFPKDFREQFMEYAGKIWGPPSKDIDYSSEVKEGRVDSHMVEWDLGNTIISFTYFGAEMYDGWVPGLCLFQITQSGKYPQLKDLICLKCEGQRKFSGFGQANRIESASPFVIFVDLNNNAIRRRDKSVWESIVQVSEDYFVAEQQQKDFKDTFTIDRKLGTYERRRTFAVNAEYEIREWGKCERIDLPTQPKF